MQVIIKRMGLESGLQYSEAMRSPDPSHVSIVSQGLWVLLLYDFILGEESITE